MFGGPFVASLAEAMQTGFLKVIADGLTLAGGVLPALGFAILLRYLPTKRHIAYLILAFSLTAIFITLFGNINAVGASTGVSNSISSVPMLAMAAIGFAFAYIVYQRSVEGGSAPVAKQNTTSDKGEIEDDEL